MELFTGAVRLAPNVYLQVSPHKFRLHRLLPWDAAPCAETLQEIGDTRVMRQMMAGAFYAAFPKPLSDNPITCKPAAPSLLRHIFYLAASYQTTRATPPTMRRVAERLAARGQHAVASYCLHVAEEESGHDTLALMDLAALGVSAHEFVEQLKPQTAVALAQLFTRFAESDTPIAVLGYGYALERMAMFWTEDSIAAIERLIPAGIKATRCLRVHSAVGTDTAHVADSIALMARLPRQDRAAIARATYEVISLLCALPPGYPGDEAMRALLARFGWSMVQTALA